VITAELIMQQVKPDSGTLRNQVCIVIQCFISTISRSGGTGGNPRLSAPLALS